VLLQAPSVFDNCGKLKLLSISAQAFQEVREPDLFFEEKEHFLIGKAVDDVITMGGGLTTLIGTQPPVFTINGGSEITGGDYVIPTATVNNGAMSMDGSYISPSTLISSKPVNRAPTCFAFDAPKTEIEKHFLKVLEDIANKKSVVSSIRADIDASFTGFGGQIKYSIEIVGRYP
jgi:hypothetical protein